MNPESPENMKMLRARRKAEHLGLYTNNQEESKAYNDRASNRHAPKPHIDATARPGDSASPNEMLGYLESIKSRKLLIVGAAFAGAVWGVISLIPESPIYEAMTSLELQGINEAFMNMNQVDPQAGTGNYSASQMNLSTQLRIIESASIITPVLTQLQREITPVSRPQSSLMGKLRNRYGEGADQNSLEFTKDALWMAATSVQARSMSGTRIITISADSKSPDVAAIFVNALANEYMRQNLEKRASTAQKTMQWLEGRLEETQYKLVQQQNKLQEFVRKSGALFVAEQDTLASSKLKQLQSDLAAIMPSLIAKRTRYEQVKKSSPESLPDVLGDPVLRDLQNKITGLKQERERLLATLTPLNPKIKPFDTQIAYLEGELVKERTNAIGRIESEYEAVKRQEQQLTAAYSGQTGAVLSQADKAVEFGLLKAEADGLRSSLNALQQQANQASVAAALPTNNVSVIDVAKPPDFPVAPNSFKRVSSSMTIGLALGCLIAIARGKFLKMRAARKFAAPGDASALFHVPELGVIPSASYRLTKRNWWSPRAKRNDTRLLQSGAPTEVAGSGELELIGPHDAPSLLADSFRLMVASITLMNKGSDANVFLVTSPGPAEGKTTLISNLAVVMAETGRRVLLVDMDLRKPRLHHLFNVNNKPGFTDLITGDAPISPRTLETFIQPTQCPGVSILPSGSMLDIKSVNQLFYSPRVSAFMGMARDLVDIVLIDAPPMMQFSEARLMASMADRVILVLRSGSTDRETALTCQQHLTEAGANLLGTILNDWNPTSHADYSGYYNYYQQQVQEN